MLRQLQNILDLELGYGTLALVGEGLRQGVLVKACQGRQSPDSPLSKDQDLGKQSQQHESCLGLKPTQSDWNFTALCNQRAQTTDRVRGLRAERNQGSMLRHGFHGNGQVLDPAISHTSVSDGDSKNLGVKYRGQGSNLGTRCLPGLQLATGGLSRC